MSGNWTFGVSFGFLACLFLGVSLLKNQGIVFWSLKQRAYLRSEAANSMLINRAGHLIYEIRNKKNPFGYLIREIKKYREQKMDREIFESITFLRNLASIENGRSYSTDYIIEKLSEYNGMLKPIYLKMLNLLRINQPKEAAELFFQQVGTQSSKDFAGLLIQWDKLEAHELMETLLSYEKTMKAVRVTEQKKRDEIISDLIYFPVVLNILVIFINFIYIAYFIDQKEMLQMFI